MRMLRNHKHLTQQLFASVLRDFQGYYFSNAMHNKACPKKNPLAAKPTG
jgi:hypothetical protein